MPILPGDSARSWDMIQEAEGCNTSREGASVCWRGSVHREWHGQGDRNLNACNLHCKCSNLQHLRCTCSAEEGSVLAVEASASLSHGACRRTVLAGGTHASPRERAMKETAERLPSVEA
jgi:hypothetical protein